MSAGRLSGRRALVTGAGRGFGRSIALALAGEGADVGVHYRSSSDGAEEVADQIRALGRRAVTTRADITSWQEVEAMVGEVWEGVGGIDILVNNAGDPAPEQQSWMEITEELVDRVLLVDVKGTLAVTHEVGRRMVIGAGGAIVNVCSNVVVTGSPRAPQYAASKYGVLGLTKSYAHALAPSVRVNAVGPGFMTTEATLVREDWNGGRDRDILERTPLRRIGDPDELARVVCFLASDDARHITGGFILCDGGFSMVGA